MKKIVIFIFGLLVLISCGKKEVNQEELVSNAAKQYYTYLLQGNYDAFVEGCYHKDSLRAEYKNQLIDNAKMFVGQQKDEHQGIKDVEVLSAKLDTASHTANVFINLHYGDKTTEQIVLPMVEKDDVWYMR